MAPAPKKMPTVLLIITSDPRSGPRAAEAMRLAGGISVWRQVRVNICLRHEASHALCEHSEEMEGGRLFAQFLPMVRESGGEIYVQATDETCLAIDPDTLLSRNLKDARLAALAAEADYVLRF